MEKDKNTTKEQKTESSLQPNRLLSFKYKIKHFSLTIIIFRSLQLTMILN